MKKIIFNVKTILVMIAVATITSCSDDNLGEEKTPKTIDYKEILTNLTDNVYTETYKNLDEQTGVLKTKLDAFQKTQNATTLKEVRDAWRASRQPWESSEAFLFGPAGESGTGALGLDPKLDSWPVAVNDLEVFLKGTKAITKDVVTGHDDTWKGFHGIEYILWGATGVKAPTDFTTRELEYLTFLATELKTNTNNLYKGWTSGGYGTIFKGAGTPAGKEWKTQKSALQAIVYVGLGGANDLSGMLNIATEVGTGKIEAAFGKPEEEESRFSHNSKVDFMNNMRSLQNVYLGNYGKNSTNKGIGTIIESKSVKLHTKFLTEVTGAINSIDAIKGTFTEAITNDRAGIQNAIDKVKKVASTLEKEIAPIIAKLETK